VVMLLSVQVSRNGGVDLLSYLLSEPGCEVDMVNFIHNGQVTKEADGAAFTFSCMAGGVLDGPGMVHCDGSRWSSAPPQCLSKYIVTLKVVWMNWSSLLTAFKI
jgi:hypothetical protein